MLDGRIDVPDMAPEEIITDDMEQLLAVLPEAARTKLAEHPRLGELVEIVIDLGRIMEARFATGFELLGEQAATHEDLQHVVQRIGDFDRDNRAGIERTLHRISAMLNRRNEVVGLTCRVGRAVYGTIDMIRDVIETGHNVLLLGPPGIGKTTKLREMARVLASEFDKRVVIVDTNNEIAGDGDIPHPAIGRARRMQVPNGCKQHDTMIQAVENHMPEVVVIDEIGNEAEAAAARTIAERGVQLIATAHGNELENLMANPTLADLVGGIQTVTLGDEEARRRGTQKVVLERQAPPTFDVAIQLEGIDRLIVYHDVADTVDRILLGMQVTPEVRLRSSDGRMEIVKRSRESVPSVSGTPQLGCLSREMRQAQSTSGSSRLFVKGLTRSKVERALRELRADAVLVNDISLADTVLTTQNHAAEMSAYSSSDCQVHAVRGNTYSQVYEAIRQMFGSSNGSIEEFALRQVEDAIAQIACSNAPVELLPQNAYIRRLQHEMAARHNLRSGSVGKEPRRRVMIYPD